MRTEYQLATLFVLAQSGVLAQNCRPALHGSLPDACTRYPHLKNAIEVMAQQHLADWYTDRSPDPAATARDVFLPKCAAQGSGDKVDGRPTVVVYGLPNKDCKDHFSSGGSNKNSADYRAFLEILAKEAENKPVIYILEPDAIGLLADGGCGNKYGYVKNLAIAFEVLGRNPNADIYLDIGYWTLGNDEQASKVAENVKKVDRNGRCKGIALNTSNYRTNREMTEYCERFARVSGKNYHCIIDTSRNYQPPPASNEWCNTKNMGIGALPTSNTGHPLVDHYVWVKTPGESDGECSGRTSDSMAGPSAGTFFAEHFESLWNNGVFVKEHGKPPIGAIRSNSNMSSYEA